MIGIHFFQRHTELHGDQVLKIDSQLLTSSESVSDSASLAARFASSILFSISVNSLGGYTRLGPVTVLCRGGKCPIAPVKEIVHYLMGLDEDFNVNTTYGDSGSTCQGGRPE